jgi:hypothetical protein
MDIYFITFHIPTRVSTPTTNTCVTIYYDNSKIIIDKININIELYIHNVLNTLYLMFVLLLIGP